MKRLRVAYLRLAREDLAEILRYIQRDSPTRAREWVDRMDRALGRLSAFPESGTVPRDARLARLGYRIIPAGEYLAFYVIHGGKVEIRRVLHGRRRFSFLLP